MSYTYFLVEAHESVSVIKFNRPPANAVTIELAREFKEVLTDVVAGKPDALVISGTGNFFSGGLDLKAVPFYSADEQRDFLQIVNALIGKLYACPVPVVAAVNGHAVAAGFILVLAADYRIGPTSHAQLGLTEARVGIPFPAAPMVVLRAELAPEHVRYTTLYARNYGPEEAVRRGVLDELRAPEEVLPRAIEVAKDLASMPADSYRRIKHQVRATAIAAIEDLNARGTDPMLQEWVTADAAEASAAVLSHAAGD